MEKRRIFFFLVVLKENKGQQRVKIMQETNWSYTRRMSSYLFLSRESSKDVTSHLGVRGDSLIMKLFSQILVLGNCQVVFLLHPTAPIPSPRAHGTPCCFNPLYRERVESTWSRWTLRLSLIHLSHYSRGAGGGSVGTTVTHLDESGLMPSLRC